MTAITSKPSPAITPQIVAEHGLSESEYQKALAILGREPNLVELGIFSVMWSEHCSYKSSKKWLKTLPTEGPQVIQGPGENAGVVDIGEGLAAIFKIESHNHPSFIEPYQGAATGVGGILRDVFTMGARPVMNLNALRFGDPAHPKTRHLLSGVVAGIGGYGNCVGVPTIGGEVNFHPSYNGNILVNAMTVGIASSDKIFYSKAAGVGNPVVYVGSKTGRDGIHGATMASAEFDDSSSEKRPTVQVGDPFTEKLLIEACLELMQSDAIVAIQDMGAAGLTSSSFEMASKGGMGVKLDLDRVPLREPEMTPYEIMLSESQERMLLVLKPGHEDEARQVFEKWDLDFAIIGQLTAGGRMVLRWNGDVVADLPIDPLAEASPEYDRPYELASAPLPYPAAKLTKQDSLLAPLARLMSSPDLASRRWIWEQYDHMVMADTLRRPGGDAAVVRIHNTNRGLAATTDCTPRYCFSDPFEGGKQAVGEAYRNLISVGAKPLAITNNLNFGNPEKPLIMGQIVGSVQGISAAAKSLSMPVVSGNVSLYNETDGKAILPTPVIGGVGLVEDIQCLAGVAFEKAGQSVLLVGKTEGWIGQSLYLREIEGLEEGAPPPVNLDTERKTGDFIRELISRGEVRSCHDISDGGLLVALSEMALAADIGVDIVLPDDTSHLAWLYGEDQARYLIAVDNPDAICEKAALLGLSIHLVAKSGGRAIQLSNGEKLSLDVLRKAHEDWMPEYMKSPVN